MQSMPARMQARTPASPAACAATRIPARCASSAIASNSSSEYCCAPATRAVRHHAARRGDLDHLGAVTDLVADAERTSRTPLAMPSYTLNGMIPGAIRWNTVRIEVAAVGRDGVPGRDDARTVDPALVDRAHERDVEQVAAGLHHQAEVAHRGEAGEQRRAGVHRAAQRAVHRVVLHAVHRGRQPAVAAGAADEEVQLHVHQPGQERDVAEVDLGRVGRDLGRDSPPTMRFPSTTITAGDRTSPASMSTQRSARRTDGVAHGDGLHDQLEIGDAGVGDARLVPALHRERHHDHASRGGASG